MVLGHRSDSNSTCNSRFRSKRGSELLCWVWMGCLLAAFLPRVFAGGSGLNVVVVVNQNSPNSIALGNYYCERRNVPPENVIRINYPVPNTSWNTNAFQSSLISPLLAMLAARQLTNQIDYVVLSMDIPFQIADGQGAFN